ncbi:MAG: tryptophan-rich sensory protein [Acidobacteria bacterium]|nr:tryptophan-rich sensory protein [Acidobacteriota bacterium]
MGDTMIALVLWIVLCVGGGALVGFTSDSGNTAWYQSLVKPAWNPPSWVFGPVWTTLYTLMGAAAWRVWSRGGWAAQTPALRLFLLQLALNFSWSYLFFKFQQVELALAEIGLLWVCIALTIRAFARVDRPAAWLLAPYLAWVTYAATLNGAIAILNP